MRQCLISIDVLNRPALYVSPSVQLKTTHNTITRSSKHEHCVVLHLLVEIVQPQFMLHCDIVMSDNLRYRHADRDRKRMREERSEDGNGWGIKRYIEGQRKGGFKVIEINVLKQSNIKSPRGNIFKFWNSTLFFSTTILWGFN